LVIAMLAAGYVAARLGVFAASDADALHRFVINLCLPATIFKLLPSLHFEPGLWVLVSVPWVLLALLAPLLYALCRALGWPRHVTGALLLCVPIGNTSFLGFPMLSALLGESAIRYALLYDQLGSFLALATYGLFITARFSGSRTPTLRETLLRVIKFPPFLAVLLALTPLVRAAWLIPIWTRIADALIPIAMFAVGLRLELRPPRPWSGLWLGLFAKLLLMPAIAFVLLRALGTPLMPMRVAVLEAGMPASITAGALAMMAELAPELAAALVGYGILLSLVTLPLLARLLGATP
jgi:predicted permease